MAIEQAVCTPGSVKDKHTHYEAVGYIDSEQVTIIIPGYIAFDFQKKFRSSIVKAEKILVEADFARNDQLTSECQSAYKPDSHLSASLTSLDQIAYQTQKARIRSVSSELELSQSKAGDVIKVKNAGDETKTAWMVYEGEINDQFSFMERTGLDRITSWRSRIEYLQFSTTLDGPAIETGVVIFSHLHKYNENYEKKSQSYEEKRQMLVNANLWGIPK